jgi:flavin reductase (DIM6/NTAB) family NADH-FMN oxidoreductase RutF
MQEPTVKESGSVSLPAVGDDPGAVRSAYAAVPSAVAVLGAAGPDESLASGVGMTVATLLPVSLEPPCLGVMVQADSRRWPRLAAYSTLGVSVLADHQGWIARRVATDAHFAGVPVRRSTAGTGVLLEGAAAWFEVRVTEQTPAGDHLFALLEVGSASIDLTREPAVFHRSQFRTLRAGDAEPGAWMWQLGDVWQ